MCRKVLFVTIVILLVAGVASARPRRKSKSTGQRQSTYAEAGGGLFVVGPGAGSTQAGAGAYETQSMITRGGWGTQTAATAVGGKSSGWSLWGAVSSWFSGYVATEQKQSF
jgi:hypothetical protein